MADKIPEAFQDVLNTRGFAHLAALMKDGSPDAHIDSLAKKYLDKDRYPLRAPGEVRVIYKIRPDKVSTMG